MTPEEASWKRDQKDSGSNGEDPFFNGAEPPVRNHDPDHERLPDDDLKRESRNKLHDMLAGFYATSDEEINDTSMDSTPVKSGGMKTPAPAEEEDIDDFFSLEDQEEPPQESVEPVTNGDDETTTVTVGEGGTPPGENETSKIESNVIGETQEDHTREDAVPVDEEDYHEMEEEKSDDPDREEKSEDSEGEKSEVTDQVESEDPFEEKSEGPDEVESEDSFEERSEDPAQVESEDPFEERSEGSFEVRGRDSDKERSEGSFEVRSEDSDGKITEDSDEEEYDTTFEGAETSESRVDGGSTRSEKEEFVDLDNPYAKIRYRMTKTAKDIKEQVRGFVSEATGKGEEDSSETKREIFNPVMISIQEVIMLFSGLLLGAIFLIFVGFRDFWYKYFDEFNNTLFVIFAGVAICGLLILFFGDSDTPRLQGTKRKKKVFSGVGSILMIIGVILVFIYRDVTGFWPFVSSLLFAFGALFFIISSRSMSREEAYRFIPVFLGIIFLVSVPIHEAQGFNASDDFETLPLEPVNTALLVLGASLTMFGIYLLRERSGYFGVWLFGILIFTLIPFHWIVDPDTGGSYEIHDQTLGIIGAFLMIAGYMMFFYRYRQFMAMSEHIFTGNRFYEEGLIREAEHHYRKAFWILEKMGNLLDYEVIWGNIGNVFAQKRDFDSAVAYFEMGLTINRENDVLWNDKGNLFYLRGEYRKAIDAYKKGILLNQKNPVLDQNLAVAQSSIGHHEEAISNYDLAIRLDPKYDKAWHNKGKSFHDLGDFEEALRCYDGTLRVNQESYAWLDRGDVLYLLERFDEALKSYDRCVRTFPDNPESWIHRGVCLYALQMYDRAINDFHKAMEIDDTLTMPYNLLGNTFAQLGDLYKAKEQYEIAVRMKPDYSRARFNLARTQARLGEDALSSYEGAIRITSRQRLNDIWFEEAIQYYNSIIDKQPANVRAWKGRGNLLFKIGKIRSAVSSFRKAVEISPDDPILHNLLGLSFRKSQQFEDGLESFNNATRLDPDFTDAWNNKGNVLYLMGHFHEALQAYNRAIEIKPDYRSAILNRHRCITQLKSDIQVESVPLKSSVEEYNTIIDDYRQQGYKVEILENLLQEGKPHIILSGFEDFKRRIATLKNAEEELEELNVDENIKVQLRTRMHDPAYMNLILDVIYDAKRKKTRGMFEKLAKLGKASSTND